MSDYGTREEHLAFCKKRALEALEYQGPKEAAASFMSDMQKHPETSEHFGLVTMLMELTQGFLDEPAAMKNYIEGFN